MTLTQTPDIRTHYLIPRKTDELYGCVITGVGTQDVAPGREYPSPNHPTGYMFDPQRGRVLQEYQLLYIIKGSGSFSNSTGSYSIQQGDMILLRPGLWHTYKPSKKTGWCEFFVGFQGEVMERLISLSFPDGEQIFNIGHNRVLIDLYQQAMDVAATDRPAAQQLLCGIVTHMLGIVNFTVRNKGVSTDRLDQIVERAKAIMQESVLQNIDLEIVASQLNISYSWFRKIFRDYTGHPPAKYFVLLKLRHAQFLLANTRESIKEIAFKLGFKSVEHFFTTFKRITGYTPNAYRKISTPDK